jgi:hypothetical protein
MSRLTVPIASSTFTDFMAFLNDEILDIIASYLTQREVKRFSRVNKRFRALSVWPATADLRRV